MKHIVFIVGSYYPNFSAVGKCVENVIGELKTNHKITVIALKNIFNQEEKEVYDGYDIYRVETLLSRNKLKFSSNILMSKIFKGISFFNIVTRRQTSDDFLAKAYTKKFLEINQNSKVDLLVPVIMPIESAKAALYIKRKIKDLKVVPYYFDEFLENRALHRIKLNKQLKSKFNLKLEKNIINKAEKILCMNQLYQNFKKKHDLNKLIFVEHPLLKNRTLINKELKNTINISFMYAGFLDKDFRNPLYMLEMFECLINEEKIELNLYTLGNCNLIIEKFVKNNDGKIINHGSLPSIQIEEKMINTDFLLAIGNKMTTQIPSKIFELLSYGKPIIYFYYTEEDPVLKLLEKYPLVIKIKQDDKLKKYNKILLSEFIKKSYKKSIEFSEIIKNYSDALPEKTAKIIENIL